LLEAKSLRDGLNGHRWMLTEKEMTESRGGYEREGLSIYRENSDVEFIVEGSNYLERLYTDLMKTKKGDFVHAMLFEVRADVMLMPNPDDIEGSKKTTLKNVLKEVVSRGVDIRLLVNCNLLHIFWAVPFCLEMNLACGYACCGVDTRHYNWVMGNLHTKSWIIQFENETVVYNGGIDISEGRWDTEKHDNSKKRQMNGDFLGSSSYHDSVMRMKGSIVVDYERHFHQSWNDPYPSFFPFQFLPKYDFVAPPYGKYKDRYQIQLLRTVGCRGVQMGFYQSMGPKGEYSSFNGLKKMIREAKKYLYMEDQFFNFPELLLIVKERLPSLEFVIILTNDQEAPPVFSDARYYQQYKALNQLREDPDQAKKVFIYNLVRDTSPNDLLFLHSKLFIADDQYIITGSFGAEQSGLTNDGETGIGIYDKKGKLVKEVRKRLWSEHLMLLKDHPLLEDPSRGLEEWQRQAQEGKNRVRNYFPKKVERNIIADLFNLLFEANGYC
jgi:phosphatidylserine/phosphatidylglycerophosphate/cardiolipin synthase-like enzyme